LNRLPEQAALTIISHLSHRPTLIRIGVPQSLDGSGLSLHVFNTRGQIVWSFVKTHQKAGYFVFPVDRHRGERSSGTEMYVCRMQIADKVLVRKFVAGK